MSVDGLGSSDDFIEVGAFWEPIAGSWEGREVSQISGETEERISKLFRLKPADSEWKHLSGSFYQRSVEVLSSTPQEENLSFMESISDLLARGSPDDQPILAPASCNFQVAQCGFGKSIKKAWKKHKVAILVGAAAVAIVVVVIVVTVSTASTGTGAALAGGCAALDGLINGNSDDQNPSGFDPGPSSSPPAIPQKEPSPNKPQSIEERWDGLKNSPYFINKDVEPSQPSSILSQSFSLPEFVPHRTAPTPNPMSFEKPKSPHFEPKPHSYEPSVYSVQRETWHQEFLKEERNPLEEIFESHGFSTEGPKEQYPALFQCPAVPYFEPYDSARPLTLIEWWNECIATGENNMIPHLEDPFFSSPPCPLDPNQSCMETGPLQGLCSPLQDKVPANSVGPNLRSCRLPTLGPVNKDMLIIAINGINTSLVEAFSHQTYLKNFLPENVGVDFIYNHSNSIGVDLAEVFAFNYLGYSPNTATLLREAWQEFHDNHRDNPDLKILVIAHSQGAIHVANAINGCPKEITDRLIVISVGPATVMLENVCYYYEAYTSKNDVVHLGQLVQPGFFDHSETGTSKWMEMTLEARENLTILDPHPDAEKFDHGLQSPTFKKPLSDALSEYINKKGEYK